MLRILAAVICVLTISGAGVYSSDTVREQLEYSGAYKLEEKLPDETREQLGRLGVELTTEGAGQITVDEVLETVADIAAERGRAPLGACLAALGLSIICALGGALAEKGGSSLHGAYETLTATAAVLTVYVPAAAFIDSAAAAVTSVCRFSTVLVPVLAGLAYAGGHTAGATAYSGFSLAVIEGITLTCSGILVPSLRVLLGISAVGSLGGGFDLGKLTAAVEKSAKWLLGIMGVLLSGAMGVSSVAAAAADSAAMKGTRFVLSGAVPVVGSAISDAIGTIGNCLTIVRSSAGSFGIIAGLFILLPTVVLALLWSGGLSFTAWAAQALGAGRPAAAMRSAASVVSITLGLLVFTAVVLTCSTALIITMRSV